MQRLHGDSRFRCASLPLDSVSKSFFFEISMLVELNVLGAVVRDVPMPARYGNETSTLSIRKILWQFPLALLKAAAAPPVETPFRSRFRPGRPLFGVGHTLDVVGNAVRRLEMALVHS